MINLSIVCITLRSYNPIDIIEGPYLSNYVPLNGVSRYWMTVDETVIRTWVDYYQGLESWLYGAVYTGPTSRPYPPGGWQLWSSALLRPSSPWSCLPCHGLSNRCTPRCPPCRGLPRRGPSRIPPRRSPVLAAVLLVILPLYFHILRQMATFSESMLVDVVGCSVVFCVSTYLEDLSCFILFCFWFHSSHSFTSIIIANQPDQLTPSDTSDAVDQRP